MCDDNDSADKNILTDEGNGLKRIYLGAYGESQRSTSDTIFFLHCLYSCNLLALTWLRMTYRCCNIAHFIKC